MINSGSMSDQPSWNKMHSARPVLPKGLRENGSNGRQQEAQEHVHVVTVFAY